MCILTVSCVEIADVYFDAIAMLKALYCQTFIKDLGPAHFVDG